MTIPKLHSSRFDELYTPPDAMPPLLKHLPKNFKTIWCPCDTLDSEIVKALVLDGREVICTHIGNDEDFFKIEKECDCIVTNPPYSNKNAFIKRCKDLGVPWALLLPLDSLCGSKRFPLLSSAGCITIAHRLEFTGKGANWFNNVWVCDWPAMKDKWYKEI